MIASPIFFWIPDSIVVYWQGRSWALWRWPASSASTPRCSPSSSRLSWWWWLRWWWLWLDDAKGFGDKDDGDEDAEYHFKLDGCPGLFLFHIEHLDHHKEDQSGTCLIRGALTYELLQAYWFNQGIRRSIQRCDFCLSEQANQCDWEKGTSFLKSNSFEISSLSSALSNSPNQAHLIGILIWTGL